MIRFACDKCGCEVAGQRYEARIEAGPVFDEDADLFDDIDLDPNESLAEMMDRLDREARMDATGGGFRFDLCEECYFEFVSSPLMKAVRARRGDNFRR